jgi:pimeloyl-ACP methyl ester carboxylesterase
VPRVFIHGDQNAHFSYLLELLKNNIHVSQIPESNHFIFYNNPDALYEVIAAFIESL